MTEPIKSLTVSNDTMQLIRQFTGLTVEESTSLLNILTASTPKEWVRTRTIGGGGSAPYVSGQKFIQRFIEAFGFLWSYEIVKTWQDKDQIVAQGRWSLHLPGRSIKRTYPDGMIEEIRYDGFTVSKDQFGSSDVKTYANDIFAKDRKGNVLKNSQGQSVVRYHKGDMMDLGNDYKSAGTDAMKKCGTLLGMFADVYGPREEAETSGPSDSQKSAFYLRAEKAGFDTKEKAEAYAAERLAKPFSEATVQEVLGLVADLIDLAKNPKK